METKLAAFRVDVSQETGEIMLLISTACGLRPVMGWPDVDIMKNYAKELLNISVQLENNDNSS